MPTGSDKETQQRCRIEVCPRFLETWDGEDGGDSVEERQRRADLKKRGLTPTQIRKMMLEQPPSAAERGNEASLVDPAASGPETAAAGGAAPNGNGQPSSPADVELSAREEQFAAPAAPASAGEPSPPPPPPSDPPSPFFDPAGYERARSEADAAEAKADAGSLASPETFGIVLSSQLDFAHFTACSRRHL
jgi:hypothetical protein